MKKSTQHLSLLSHILPNVPIIKHVTYVIVSMLSYDEYILVGLSRCRLRPTNFENPDLHGWRGGGVARGCKFAGAGQFYFDLPLPGWSIGGCRQLDQVAI